jgi:hypothetical protein
MVVQIANLTRLWDFLISGRGQNRFAARVAAEALGWRRAAHVAQLVEHVLGKDEVTGSIPVMGSRTGSGPAADNKKIELVKQEN